MQKLVPHNGESHLGGDHQSHRLSNSFHTASESWGNCSASHAQHQCLSPWLNHLLFFFFSPHSWLYVLQVCICQCALALTYWGELLNSSPLHPSQFFLAQALNRRSPGLLELNHNYLPSSDRGESVHCVIPISPLDIKNVPQTQKGKRNVALMDLTAEAEFETGLPSTLVALALLSLLSLHLFIRVYHPHSIHLSFISTPICFSPSLCLPSLLPFQSTTGAIVCMPARKKKKKRICLGLKM